MNSLQQSMYCGIDRICQQVKLFFVPGQIRSNKNGCMYVKKIPKNIRMLNCMIKSHIILTFLYDFRTLYKPFLFFLAIYVSNVSRFQCKQKILKKIFYNSFWNIIFPRKCAILYYIWGAVIRISFVLWTVIWYLLIFFPFARLIFCAVTFLIYN